ncbi:MAG: hypothetical protein IT298_09570 [Chloroflexi bacterium]|nr:MAG: hypothetical protein UZ13_03203 [Chloroflexi bacterium OLB13]MBV6436084.1 hypothetical protein [Anaerolineae bacterium]MCC6565996.1 hypothetical protein [Chloroflexota bacterium]MDL1914866.1 hypothetical protein [Anaerolineae bacterium CFX4]MBW7878769.1 hypothetical protein [Anaerolineae bacterium]
MRPSTRVLGVIALLMLTALPALAQEAEAAASVDAPQGLGLLMLLIGLSAVAVIGLLMSRRESSGSDDDLV